MGTEQLHDKLFQAARQHLKDHEEPFDGSDWDRMERGLDQLPASRQFKFSFSLNSVLVLVGITGLALGGYALLGGSSSKENALASPTPLPLVKTAAPAKNETVTPPASSSSDPAAGITENKTATAGATTADDNPAQPRQHDSFADAKSSGRMKNSTGVSRNGNNTPLNDADFIPLAGGNEGDFSNLVFPDQIDSRYGPVMETQEDPARLSTVPEVDPSKLTYYDHVNGKPVPIHIKTDSSKTGKEKKKSNDRREKRKKQGQADSSSGNGDAAPTATGNNGE